MTYPRSIRLALVLGSLIALAACTDPTPPAPAPAAPVIVDDECPRADGQPCR